MFGCISFFFATAKSEKKPIGRKKIKINYNNKKADSENDR